MDAYATELLRQQRARARAAKRLGLAKHPLPAPPAPRQKPHINTRKGFEADDHEGLPNLSCERQKREIRGMQDVIEQRYGTRPAVFRPPFGNYNEDTLRAARSCGIKAAPLWNAEVFVDHWDYREGDRDLHPGDIVLSHFRGKEHWKGTMPDMVRRFLELVTDKGYAVARLEDYL